MGAFTEILRKNKSAEPPPGFYIATGSKLGAYRNDAGEYWYPPKGGGAPEKRESKKEGRKIESASVLHAKDEVDQAAGVLDEKQAAELRSDLDTALSKEGGERTYAVAKVRAKAKAVNRLQAQREKGKAQAEAKAARAKEREEAKAAKDKEREQGRRERSAEKGRATVAQEKKARADRERVKDAIADAPEGLKDQLRRRLEGADTPAKLSALARYADQRVAAERRGAGEEDKEPSQTALKENTLGDDFNRQMAAEAKALEESGMSAREAFTEINRRISRTENIVERFNPRTAKNGEAVIRGGDKEALKVQAAALNHVYGKSHAFRASGSGRRGKVVAYKIGSREARREIED